MKLSPKHLALYQRIAVLFVRHAKPAILEQTTFREHADAEGAEGGDNPEEFVRALEDMGPTFVKLGQLLSTRGDLLPHRYIVALERLQDDVEPLPFEEIESVLHEGIGARLSKAFESFDRTPMASASLGQVHKAVLRGGKEVVVKVQRPNIRSQIATDIEALASVAEYADEHSDLGRKYRFSGIIEQFRRSLVDELDYELEAQNLREMGRALKGFPLLVVPQPIGSYCSDRVLTMEYIRGAKVTEVSGVVKTELNGERLADEVFRAYLHQVLIKGFYHADPHPGNLLVTEDRKIGLIDLGMVGRISERMRDELFNLLSAICENHSDKVAEVSLRMGESFNPKINRRAFTGELAELVGRSRNAAVEEMQFGSVVMDIMRISTEYGIRIPREIAMLGKTLLNLDRVGLALSPKFNPNSSIRQNLNDLARKRSLDTLKAGNLVSAVLEMKELISKSPQRINDFLAIVSENRMRLEVDAFDQKALLRGFQKIANRITMGAIIGSMIVGASYMMPIKTDFMLFGYPGLPLLLFIFAGICGTLVVISILKNDE